LTAAANDQYIIVCSISRECLEELISRKITTPFRSDYFPLLNVAVLRVCMPSTLHNLVTSTFKVLFDELVTAMGIPLRNYRWLLDRMQKEKNGLMTASFRLQKIGPGLFWKPGRLREPKALKTLLNGGYMKVEMLSALFSYLILM
jgi:hypothetical protein